MKLEPKQSFLITASRYTQYLDKALRIHTSNNVQFTWLRIQFTMTRIELSQQQLAKRHVSKGKREGGGSYERLCLHGVTLIKLGGFARFTGWPRGLKKKFRDKEGKCVPFGKWIEYLSKIVVSSYTVLFLFNRNIFSMHAPGQLPPVIFTSSIAISPVYEPPTIPSNVTCKHIYSSILDASSFDIPVTHD